VKLTIEIKPKFNGVGDKNAAATAFVKHLNESEWWIGSDFATSKAKVVACHDIGARDEPSFSIRLDVVDPKLEVTEFEVVFS
jgi:hypothetical protein